MGKRQRRRVRDQRASVVPQQPSPDDQGRIAADKATARLRRLVDQLAVIDREIDAEIDRLEGWGFSWPTIARALGVTRQAARQRYLRQRISTPAVDPSSAEALVGSSCASRHR